MPKLAFPKRHTHAEVRSWEHLTPTEVDKLRKTARSIGCHGERNATMILLAYRHGLRVSELITLRWGSPSTPINSGMRVGIRWPTTSRLHEPSNSSWSIATSSTQSNTRGWRQGGFRIFGAMRTKQATIQGRSGPYHIQWVAL